MNACELRDKIYDALHGAILKTGLDLTTSDVIVIIHPRQWNEIICSAEFFLIHDNLTIDSKFIGAEVIKTCDREFEIIVRVLDKIK